MKVEAVHQFTDKDPIDISELLCGELARKKKRLSLMRNFVWWAYFKESKRWTEANNEERIIVHRHFGHARFMGIFGAASTFIVYNAFLRGIYNYRARELINMRKVPFAMKFGIASMFGLYVARDMYIKALYEPDLYKVALKYRTYYDKEYREETVQSEEIINQ